MKYLNKIIFIVILLIGIFQASSAFANTCVYNGTTNSWTSAAAWTGCGGVAPTASDDVLVGTGSGGSTTGTLTIVAGSVARSANFTSFAGTLIQGSTGTLTLGDATAGAGNVALNMPSGFTYAPNSASTISFISTSATQQTVLINSGYTAGNITFNSTSNGNYAIIANLTTATASIVTLTAGTLHTDGTSDNSGLTHTVGIFNSSNTNTRTLNLGSSTITSSAGSVTPFTISNMNGLTFLAINSTITLTGNNALLSAGNSGGPAAFGTVNLLGIGSGQPATPLASFVNLTITGRANKTDSLSLGANITITNSLTISGNTGTAGASVNRLLVTSSVLGTARVLTVSGATVSMNNVDLRDITFARTDAGGLDLTNGGANLIGDCGGNSRTGGNGTVTFTPASTQTSTGTASFTWSTHAWTSRVPLPQDDVVISNAFISGQTVTADMPRLGKNITWAGATWAGTAPVWSFTAATTIYGSVTLVSGITISNAAINTTFEGRASFTLTSAGVNWANSQIVINMFGGTLTLQDAFASTRTLTLTLGTFNANGFNVTLTSATFVSSASVIVNAGSGTWTLTSTSGVWSMGALSVFNAQGSTIIISNNTATAKTFGGGGATYNNISFTGDNITVTGSNTFNGNFFIGKANKTTGLLLTNGSTQTFGASSSITTDSDASNKAIFKGVSATATVTKPSGTRISVNFLQLTNVAATQTSFWYAGTGSVDNGGNTNWVFTGPPRGNFFMFY